MRILDVFSWLPAKELSIEKIEELVESLNNGIENNEGYSLKKKLPENSNDNIIGTTEELIGEGKEVCYLVKDDNTIAVIGYK